MSVLSSLFKRILKGRGDDIAEKLAQATEMGGFMHPSLAVTAPGRGGGTLNPSYGDIVMLANREQLMPKAGKAVIADRDIWSPTVPRGRTEIDEKALDRLLKANGVKASASNLVRFGDINLDSPREGLVGLYRAFKNKPDVGLTDVVDTDDYKDFVKNIADKIAGNRVFEHQTASGNWTTKPYTPENIDRFLSSGGAVNRTGWYLDGKDALLSQTRRFKSPTPLYGQANRLMDKELSNQPLTLPLTILVTFLSRWVMTGCRSSTTRHMLYPR